MVLNNLEHKPFLESLNPQSKLHIILSNNSNFLIKRQLLNIGNKACISEAKTQYLEKFTSLQPTIDYENCQTFLS